MTLDLGGVDLFDPEVQENWYPAYDLLRSQTPVWQMPGTHTFVVTSDRTRRAIFKWINCVGLRSSLTPATYVK